MTPIDISQQFLAIHNELLSPEGICDHFSILSEDFAWIATTGREVLQNKQANSLTRLEVLLGKAVNLHTAFDVFPTKQLLCTVYERCANDLYAHAQDGQQGLFDEEPYVSFMARLYSHLILSRKALLFAGTRDVYLTAITDRLTALANLRCDGGMLLTAGTIRCFDDWQLVEAYVAKNKNW